VENQGPTSAMKNPMSIFFFGMAAATLSNGNNITFYIEV
jgi:hypothetical protein